MCVCIPNFGGTDTSNFCVVNFLKNPDLSSDPEFGARAASAGGLDGSVFGLEDFSYENHVIRERIFEHMSQTSFMGITVGVVMGVA